SLRTVGVDLQIALVDLDGGVVGKERRDDHRGERGVPAVRRVERRQAHEPVLAALGLEDAVGVLAGDAERRRLEPRLLARARLVELDAEAAVRGPALVHPQHHLGPVLGVGAARPGLERHDCVAGVVLAVEQRRLLQPLELGAQRREQLADLALHVAAVERGELLRVLVVAGERAVAVEPARDARVLGRDSRRLLLVVPEARRVHLLLERYETGFERSGVKGTHGPSRAGPRARRAVPAAVSAPPSRGGWYRSAGADPRGRRSGERAEAAGHVEREGELDEPGAADVEARQPAVRP